MYYTYACDASAPTYCAVATQVCKDACCPTGYSCQETPARCLPIVINCEDNDNDERFGKTDTCLTGTDCNDFSAARWQILSGYADGDLDGYGSGGLVTVCSGSVEKCSQGKWLGCAEGDYKANSQYYEREEVSCDRIDNDCDGLIDEEGACNKAPLMRPLGDFTVAEGQLLQFKVTATDAEQDALTYEAKPLPEGAEFDAKNGVFTWVPGFAQSGTYFMTIGASDGFLISTQQTKITVADVNQKPVIISATYDTSIKEGEKIELSITATDPDGDRISYEWRKEGKVIGLSETYFFALKQGDTGVHKFNATASDGRLTDSRVITVTVEKAGECKEGEVKSCLLKLGVCAGAKATCISGVWQECAPQAYGPLYQGIETRCDGLDNDCDGIVDNPNLCEWKRSPERLSRPLQNEIIGG